MDESGDPTYQCQHCDLIAKRPLKMKESSQQPPPSSDKSDGPDDQDLDSTGISVVAPAQPASGNANPKRSPAPPMKSRQIAIQQCAMAVGEHKGCRGGKE